MSAPNYIWHITLNTGHSRRSPRSEVSDTVINILRPILDRALSEPGVQVPVMPDTPHITLEAHRIGAHLVVTVRDGQVPLFSFGVATRSRGAARLWDALHAGGTGLATTPADVPRAPWCGAAFYATLAEHPDGLAWPADLQRCIAWTWMEMRDA